MRKLVLFSLAAGAMLAPGSALAMQQNTVDPPVPWEDVPAAELKGAEAAGTSWQRPAPPPRPAAPMPAMNHAPARAPIVRHAPAPAPRVHHAPAAMVHAAPAAGAMHGGRRFNRFNSYHRVDRGWRMPHYWHGPRFHVMNWRSYGFPAPRPGWVWIRYYDDALLIDRDGTVHDGRYGFDWDRYDDRWERDDYGVPYHPGDEDFEDFDYRDGPDVLHRRDYPAPGYGHAYGYPMVVTETVTTTTSHGRSHHGKHKVVHHRADCDCEPMMAPPPPPPPPPPIGEKG